MDVLRQFPKSRLICRIDVSAFFAVMMTLLFLMMLSISDYHSGNWMAVDLPRAESAVGKPRAERFDALIVVIKRDGTVLFDRTKVPPKDLPAKIRERVIKGAEPRIYFRVDFRSRYGVLMEVLDALRFSGIKDITFLANAPKQIGSRSQPR